LSNNVASEFTIIEPYELPLLQKCSMAVLTSEIWWARPLGEGVGL